MIRDGKSLLVEAIKAGEDSVSMSGMRELANGIVNLQKETMSKEGIVKGHSSGENVLNSAIEAGKTSVSVSNMREQSLKIMELQQRSDNKSVSISMSRKMF